MVATTGPSRAGASYVPRVDCWFCRSERVEFRRILCVTCSSFLALSLNGCAGKPHTRQDNGRYYRQHYRAMDPDTRRVFLAYYPVLNPLQRRLFAENWRKSYRLLKHWKLDTLYFDTSSEFGHEVDTDQFNYSLDTKDIELDTVREFQGERSSYSIERVEITKAGTKKEGNIYEGLTVPLKAIVHYADGRKVEATRDVLWSAEPSSLARVEEAELRFECASSDIHVSADFLGERIETATFRVRKPLHSLELNLTGSSLTWDENEFFTFEAIARCADGTSAKVSCQSQWSVVSEEQGEISGCGHFRIKTLPDSTTSESASPKSASTVEIKVSYGGLTTIKRFVLPMPRRARYGSGP